MQFPFKLCISFKGYRYQCFPFLSLSLSHFTDLILLSGASSNLLITLSQDKDLLEKLMISDIQHGLFEWSLVCIKC